MDNLLSIVTFLPALAALILALFLKGGDAAADRNAKWLALIATSGSAPGHWLPAMIEANRAGLPLILLSADRPAALQACGSNQTVDQTHLFGNQVRAFHDAGAPAAEAASLAHIRRLGVQAVHQACGPDPGPVHLNLPFANDAEFGRLHAAIRFLLPMLQRFEDTGQAQMLELGRELVGQFHDTPPTQSPNSSSTERTKRRATGVDIGSATGAVSKPSRRMRLTVA